MISIFSGTNRKGSNSRVLAEYVAQQLRERTKEEVRVFCLEDLPEDFVHQRMYDKGQQSKSIEAIQNEYLIPASKLYFIIPEYNGGVPGVLKTFIDACSIREYSASFHGGKKAALLGLASGRSGNLRGLEYFGSCLNYLKITVLPNKLPVSSIDGLIQDKELRDEHTQKAINAQIDEFIAF